MEDDITPTVNGHRGRASKVSEYPAGVEDERDLVEREHAPAGIEVERARSAYRALLGWKLQVSTSYTRSKTIGVEGEWASGS